MELERNFKHKKALGQNFLTDSNICRKIVERADVKDGVVLEIGPGSGMLTNELLKRARKVIAIEKDSDLIPVLEDKFSGCLNLQLINADFLKINLEEIVEENLKYGDFKICANLPYYITSPIIVKILEAKLKIKSITLMVQKEVALRLVAKPGTKEYGSISVFVQYFSRPEILFNVAKTCFFPKPKVDSAVVSLIKEDKTENFAEDEDLFFKVLRASFSQRRKKILNPLSSFFSIDKAILEKILGSVINLNKRAEEISKEQYIDISNRLSTYFKFITR